MIEYIATAHVVPSLQLPRVNLEVSSLVNPQFSATSVKAPAPKVAGSLLLLEGSAASVSQVYQEQVFTGETTQNIVTFQLVQEQVEVQEIPEVQVVERIQKQTVPERIEEQIGDIPVPPIVEETVEVVRIIPHKRLQQRTVEQMVNALVPQVVDGTSERVRVRTAEQIVHAPIPLTQEQIAEQIENNPIPQIAAVGPVGVSTAPVHSQARRDLFGAEETTQNIVEIPTVHEPVTDETFRKLETIIDALSPLNSLTDLTVRMENIVAQVQTSN